MYSGQASSKLCRPMTCTWKLKSKVYNQRYINKQGNWKPLQMLLQAGTLLFNIPLARDTTASALHLLYVVNLLFMEPVADVATWHVYYHAINTSLSTLLAVG